MADTKPAKPDHEAEAKRIACILSNNLGADVLVYAGLLYPPLDVTVCQHIRQNKSADNLLFALTTFGGVADSAFRLARCVQEVYGGGKSILLVDTFCKSAGTLLALGANEIVMSPDAEFGPLDVQLRKTDELDERTSGLTPMQALATLRSEVYETFEQILVKLRRKTRISTKIAAEIAASITEGVFSPIYSQLDPLRLGENQRAMLIAEEYGRRLAKRSSNLKDKALEKLLGNYPSHEFVVDLSEAAELFENLSMADGEMREFAATIRNPSIQAVFDDSAEERPTNFIRFWSKAELNSPQKDKTDVTGKSGDLRKDDGASGEEAGSPVPTEQETVHGDGQEQEHAVQVSSSGES